MQFIEIVPGTARYDEELALRDAILRRPLGLKITDQDREEDKAQLHFGIIENDALIACVVVVDLGNGHAKIRQMAVVEERQRQGFGSELIRHTEASLRDRGFRNVELNAREVAINFYQRLGYAPVGDQFTEVTIPHQKMVRTL